MIIAVLPLAPNALHIDTRDVMRYAQGSVV